MTNQAGLAMLMGEIAMIEEILAAAAALLTIADLVIKHIKEKALIVQVRYV